MPKKCFSGEGIKRLERLFAAWQIPDGRVAVAVGVGIAGGGETFYPRERCWSSSRHPQATGDGRAAREEGEKLVRLPASEMFETAKKKIAG